MQPLVLLGLAGLVSTPAAVFFGIAWWNARRELEIRRELGQLAPGRQSADSGRLELAIEAMAIEVERITEGQRFMTQLLAERSAAEHAPRERPPRPGSESRIITPH